VIVADGYNVTIMAGAADVRYAFRLLAKTPAVTFVALLSLALGIGANTAIFGVINALLLRTLPVHEPERLVKLRALDPKHPDQNGELSLAMLREIQQHAPGFSSVFAWSGGGVGNFEANGVRYAGSVDTVAGDYFDTLGIHAVLGRMLRSDDKQEAVISYGCWRNRYAGDPNVIGKIIRIDDRPLTIVGVAPEDFAGLIIDIAADATVPIGYRGHELKDRENLWYAVIARLKPGVSIEHARAQMRVLWPGILKSTTPDGFQGAQRASFLKLQSDVQSAARGNSYLRSRLEKPLEILMALVGAVLLIACVNLANLLLARAASRQHEFAMRVALGAPRRQLIRMLLTEALLLSVTGAVLGILIARWTARYLLASFWAGFVPLFIDPAPDVRVLAFTAMLAIVTGLLFGMLPAWRMSRSDPAGTLRQTSRTTGGHMGRLNGALVIAQVALSLILLLGATLFVRSLRNLETVDLGYRRDHMLIMQLFPRAGHEKISNRTQYYRDLATRLSGTPGVDSVSYLHMGPATGYEYKVPVSSGSRGTVAAAAEEWAGPGVFHVMGMHVLAGREFDWRDDEHGPRVAVISASLARALFSNQNPIGCSIDAGDAPEHKGLTIVGVVNSASLWKLDSREPLAVYHSLMQEPSFDQPRVVMRTVSAPQSIARTAERTLESLGYHYSLRTSTLEQRTADTLASERMIAQLASGFGALALLLAAVGLYGILSYAVTQRTPEIGIRMALGAKRTDVLLMILWAALRIVVIGVAVAAPVVFFCGKLISGMLFGVTAADPAAVVIAVSTLAAVAAIAGFLPARKASRVDPMVALRCE
jgi:putative ABC transport system permease protein